MPEATPDQPKSSQQDHETQQRGHPGVINHDPPENRAEHAGAAANGREPAGQQQPHGRAPPDDADHRSAPGNEKQQRYERIYWMITGAASVAATLATITAAVFAIGAYNASWQAVGAARDQADIARRSLVASDRPWVMLIDIKPASFSSDDDAGVMLSVNISVKNVGHSPAQNVSITGRLLIGDFDPPPDQAMASVCQEPRSSYFVIPGQALFPDRDQDVYGGSAYPFGISAERVWEARAARINSTREYNIAIGRPDRAQAWAESLSKFPFYAALNLVGCINYRSSDNAALYQTSFMFSVSAKPGGEGLPLLGGKRPVIIPPSTTPEDPDIMVVHPRMIQRIVPGDQIKLEKPLHSTFAN